MLPPLRMTDPEKAQAIGDIVCKLPMFSTGYLSALAEAMEKRLRSRERKDCRLRLAGGNGKRQQQVEVNQ